MEPQTPPKQPPPTDADRTALHNAHKLDAVRQPPPLLTLTKSEGGKLNAVFVGIGRWIGRVPFGVVPAVGAVLSFLILVIIHLSHHLTRLEIFISELCALTFFFAIDAASRWREAKDRYKDLREEGEKLLELHGTAPIQLKGYIRMSVAKKIASLLDLSVGRSADCTYPEQIAIADSLAKGATQRFWATSTDAPSKLWGEGISYFNTLAELGIQNPVLAKKTVPPGKTRLVMLTLDELFKDYSVYYDDFSEFVTWHTVNDFDLSFYVVDPDEDLGETIGRAVVDSEPLKDFLIKDDAFVYGRTVTLGGSGVRFHQWRE